jgi:hypothetical protein
VRDQITFMHWEQSWSGPRVVKCRSWQRASSSVSWKWVICHGQEKLLDLGTEAVVLPCSNLLGEACDE